MNLKIWKRLLTAAYLLAIIPLLVIAFYNHPSADDYWYSAAVRLGIENHGFFGIISGILYIISNTYKTWQGTYAGIFLFSLQPSVFGEHLYFLTTYILLLTLTLSTFYFFRCLADTMHFSRELSDISTLIILILSVELLPSAVQGFFWWNGASYYVIFHCFMLIETGIFIRILSKPKFYHHILAILLAIILGGGNYVTAILVLDIIVLFLIYSLIFANKKTKLFMLTISVVYLTSFLVNILAPGNAQRIAICKGLPPLKAILLSFHYTYKYIHEWSTLPVLLALLFLAVFFSYIQLPDALVKKINKVPFFAYIVMALCIFSSSFTPTLYAMAYEGEGRTQNIRYFLFLIFLVLIELLAILRIKHYLKIFVFPLNATTETSALRHKIRIWYIVPILVCLCIFILDTHEFGDRNTISSLSASISLFFGEAKLYDEEAEMRLELLNSDSTNIEFSEFSVKPYVLFFDDVEEDASCWKNVYMADYYNKNSIKLSPSAK